MGPIIGPILLTCSQTTGFYTPESTVIPRRQTGLERHLMIQNPGAQRNKHPSLLCHSLSNSEARLKHGSVIHSVSRVTENQLAIALHVSSPTVFHG